MGATSLVSRVVLGYPGKARAYALPVDYSFASMLRLCPRWRASFLEDIIQNESLHADAR
jgi:hypothetical protein